MSASYYVSISPPLKVGNDHHRNKTH